MEFILLSQVGKRQASISTKFDYHRYSHLNAAVKLLILGNVVEMIFVLPRVHFLFEPCISVFEYSIHKRMSYCS